MRGEHGREKDSGDNRCRKGKVRTPGENRRMTKEEKKKNLFKSLEIV